ncbi:MAG TPA: mechanosensitive ion channel family protein [Solirubrobacteraceae bacterium]|nr:mechanosensitive ion channel family protein [Solirubrobacteraceae bacterium]
MQFAAVLKDDGSWGVVIGAIVGALLLAFVIERVLSRRAERLAAAVTRGHISPETATRLRFVRRFAYAVILLIGVAIALSQFSGVDEIAASLLASGVVAAAIIGFAARQTLANFVAGVMLAITQPIRVGDWVRFEDHYGEVVDVRLNYTFLRTAGDARLVIPNERLAAGILQNDTLVADTVGLDVEVWIPPGADAARAVEILQAESGGAVTVAEIAPAGVRLAVGCDPVPPRELAGRQADLRARCHARLRADGLLEGFAAPDRS